MRSNKLKLSLCAISIVFVAFAAITAYSPRAITKELLRISTPYVPDPSKCTIESRPVPSPPTSPATSPIPEETLPPPGPLVPSDVVAEITAVVEGAIACTNAGDTLRALAYFTDEYVAQMFTGPDAVDYEGFLQYLSTPVAVLDESDRLEIVEISGVAQHRLGLVSAVVTTRNSDETFEDFVLFVKEDGTWLIAGSGPVETIYATPSP